MANIYSRLQQMRWTDSASLVWVVPMLVALLYLAVSISSTLYVVVPSAAYLPFHTIVEISAALVAGLVFGIGWHSYHAERPVAISIVACAFLAVGLLDFLHMVSYAGMPDFVTPSSPSKAIYFWLAAKLVMAGAMLASVPLMDRAFTRTWQRWVLLCGAIAIVLLVAWGVLIHQDFLPEVYVPGKGLTAIKVRVEYFVITLHLFTIILLWRRQWIPMWDHRLLIAGLFVLSVSELCFTNYVSVTDTFNLLGHLFKVVGYLFVYRAVFICGVRDPYVRLRKTEAAVQTEKTVIQAILDSLDSAVFKVNTEARIEYLNAAACRMLGLDAQSCLGKPFTDIVHIVNEADTSSYQLPVSQYLGGVQEMSSQRQLLVVREDGVKVPIEDTASTIYGAQHKVIGAVITLRDVRERRKAMNALLQSEHMFHDLLEFAPDGILIVDEQGNIRMVNHLAEKLFGYDREELVGRPVDVLIPQRLRGDHGRYRTNFQGQPHVRPMGAGKQIYCLRKDGSEFPSDISLGPLKTESGNLVMAVVRDMTERRNQEAAVRESARYARSLLEASLDPLATINANGQITDVNQAMEKATGLPRDMLIGTDFSTYFKDPELAREGYKRAFWDNEVRDWPLTMLSSDGHSIEVLYNATVFRDEQGCVQGVFAAARDVTERKGLEEQLKHRATHDALTGLPNRSLLSDRLRQWIAQARRENEAVGVMFIDLDNFKNINDSLGHAVGDALLMETAWRVKKILRESDTLARFGGDEFVLVLGNTDVHDMDALARKVLETISVPCEVQGHQIFANASMGISIFPLDGEDDELLIRNADIAMYYAKKDGRNTYRYYSHEMNQDMRERLELSTKLKNAIAQRQFELFYQPKVCLKSGRLAGFEALIRWRHPELGMVSPVKFISIAEECGMMGQIGDWVINTACKQIRDWLDHGYDPVRVAVNLSACQCRTEEVVHSISDALLANDIPGERLEVEITESMVMQDTVRAIQVFERLRSLNVQIAIDDFGTGYSSLSYLKRFPVTSLKIDKSFVDGINNDDDDVAIVGAVIAMAKNLMLNVVAEGVETLEQVEFLSQHGCDECQGYFYGKPMPADEAGRFIAEWGLKVR